MFADLPESSSRTCPEPIPAKILAQLAALRRRRALEDSPLYREYAGQVQELTQALLSGRPKVPAPRPERSFLRIASWNLARGRHLDATVRTLQDDPEFAALDALLLCEVDVGMARSGNRNVPGEIAEALGFEWVFGNSYLCLDHGDVRDGEQSVDNELGMHGNAVLSRYPIRRGYNCSIHITRDKFESRSEPRLGHKKALCADVETPLGDITLVTTHLDSIATCRQRQAQMEDILAAVKDRERVLIGGDLNTTTFDVGGVHTALGIGAKILRGGIGHVFHHYLHPYEHYEKGLFDELQAHGFDWRSFNDLATETFRYDVHCPHSVSEMREHVPDSMVRLAQRLTAKWGGKARGRLDWMAGRGLLALQGGEKVSPESRVAEGPRVRPVPRPDGVALSDHDILLVDVAFE